MADMGAADSTGGVGQQQGTPDFKPPMLVHDVSTDHIWYGRVAKQLYTMLWIACAFLLGSILAWRTEPGAGMTLFQAVLCIMSLSAVWACILGVRGGRPQIGALFMVEMVAIIAVVLHYNAVSSVATTKQHAALGAINIQIESLEKRGAKPNSPEINALSAEYDRILASEGWGVGDLVQAPFSQFRRVDDPIRHKQEGAWANFGTGFYLTTLTSIFFLLFFIASVVIAVKSAKPREDAAPSRPARKVKDGASPDPAKSPSKPGDSPKI